MSVSYERIPSYRLYIKREIQKLTRHNNIFNDDAYNEDICIVFDYFKKIYPRIFVAHANASNSEGNE